MTVKITPRPLLALALAGAPGAWVVAALALAFASSTDAATERPTIEPFQVNARSIGSCETYDPKDPYNLNNGAGADSLSPLGAIGDYVQSYQKSYLTDVQPADYLVKYVEQPQHGVIKSVSREGSVVDLYIPNAGYAGNDRYVAEVTLKGIKFKVTGFLRPSSDVMSGYADVCRRLGLPGTAWKISDATGSNPGDLPLTMQASLAAALGSLELEMADLAGGAVAQTIGFGTQTSIILDTAAAGHGRYIDPTPLDPSTGSGLANDDYLPTSNPNIWQAKAGSAAEGKMDLLSVLLHEYGHALGLEHSADSADFMSATLQSGQRRLPSSEELTWRSQLVPHADARPAA